MDGELNINVGFIFDLLSSEEEFDELPIAKLFGGGEKVNSLEQPQEDKNKISNEFNNPWENPIRIKKYLLSIWVELIDKMFRKKRLSNFIDSTKSVKIKENLNKQIKSPWINSANTRKVIPSNF